MTHNLAGFSNHYNVADWPSLHRIVDKVQLIKSAFQLSPSFTNENRHHLVYLVKSEF